MGNGKGSPKVALLAQSVIEFVLQADALREAQLAETAGRAGEVVAKARRRQAEQRQRDADEAEQKRRQLEARLNRAQLSREAQRPIPQVISLIHDQNMLCCLELCLFENMHWW